MITKYRSGKSVATPTQQQSQKTIPQKNLSEPTIHVTVGLWCNAAFSTTGWPKKLAIIMYHH